MVTFFIIREIILRKRWPIAKNTNIEFEIQNRRFKFLNKKKIKQASLK